MLLKLPASPTGYNSKSQIARVRTEEWGGKNLYCPSCGDNLSCMPNNNPVVDFECHQCKLTFQLKSQSHRFSSSVIGASYLATLQHIKNKSQPSLFLLHYDDISSFVENIQLIHGKCIEENCISRRRALSNTAKRKGFEGFMLNLPKVLRTGRIPIVYEGRQLEKDVVMGQWASVEKIMPILSSLIGWQKEVMFYIDRLGTDFSLRDFDDKYSEWQTKYPSNNNIEAKVRQQLQFLRDRGLIQFLGRGTYRRNW